MKLKGHRIKRKIVILKTMMQRGYLWLQTPSLAIIGAGILKPYFPNIRFVYLAIISISIFIFVGFLDYKLKLIHEEANFSTEINETMMRGLYKDKK